MKKHAFSLIGAALIAVVAWYFLSGHQEGDHKAHQNQGVQVSNAWSIPIPASSKNAAAYLVIKNGGPADELLSIDSPAADMMQMHDITKEDGQMKMLHMPTVPIPENGEVIFEPGGMHMMLVGLKQTMDQGKEYELTLTFRDAGAIKTTALVTNEQVDLKMDHSGH